MVFLLGMLFSTQPPSLPAEEAPASLLAADHAAGRLVAELLKSVKDAVIRPPKTAPRSLHSQIKIPGSALGVIQAQTL